ncbi:MAG: hypothetical protein SOX11_10360 [Lachnospiraceae bacterium]|nr:hypothetical protein [Lachnospiraceae bacterium]MDY3223528.1 hypothetical protein [Lachnospiraceae bacterium]
MKKVLKIVLIIFLVIALLIAGIIFLLFHTLKSELGDHWEDYAKIFAMQTEANKDLPPLENIEQREIDVRYIRKDGTIESRPVRLYIPEEVEQPMPLIYVPHYEMAENAAELRRYLEQGWAVASPINVLPSHNGLLTDDDLVFNNAALYTLRHMDEFDNQRIAIVGGSAGGYTTLMLSALQMGNCVSIATAPIANVYFNFYQYFQMAQRDDAPFFLKLVRDSFAPILDNFPDVKDTERWEAFSAVGLADCFNSPLVITHVTSDILVPIDQITREFTYDHEGNSMPEDFSTRLSEDNPGVLGRSLSDELPAELTHVEHIIIEDLDADSDLPYNEKKLFNLNIYDDGPTESYGSHRATSGTGVVNDVPYLKAMFDRGLVQNEILTNGKLILLLERYMGESVQLPVHEGVDDSIYGSLAIYRQEIVEELACWAKNHSIDELDTAMKSAIAERDGDKYIEVWDKIYNDIMYTLR